MISVEANFCTLSDGKRNNCYKIGCYKIGAGFRVGLYDDVGVDEAFYDRYSP